MEAGQGYKVMLTGFKGGKKWTFDERSGLANASVFPASNAFIIRIAWSWGDGSLGKGLATHMSL